LPGSDESAKIKGKLKSEGRQGELTVDSLFMIVYNFHPFGTAKPIDSHYGSKRARRLAAPQKEGKIKMDFHRRRSQ
jgi:hypothetical protein